MATKVIIPTSYGSPSATFWINDQKYVLPTGVEVTAPDEVALLISQHEAQEKREEPQYLPDVVDVNKINKLLIEARTKFYKK